MVLRWISLVPPPIEPTVAPLQPLEAQPVIPLYATPLARTGRPGIITLLGVAAIVIALLSLLVGGVCGMMALGFMIQTKVMKTATASMTVSSSSRGSVNTRVITRASPATPAQSPTTASTASSGFPTGPRGVADAQRLTIEDALSRAQRLSAGQTRRLDQLLAKSGKDIFPFGIATNTMQTAISESGTLSSNGATANYYLLASGKLEIYDDRAIFFPSDGEPVRVRADDPNEDETSNALPAQTIDVLIASAQSQTGNKLTPAQVTALKNELSDPNQVLVAPRSNPAAISASITPDGTLSVFGNSYIQIDSSGNVSNSAKLMMAAAARMAVRGAASTMTLLDALFSGALSIYLLVVGILVLRQTQRGRGLQMTYAILKVPVAVLAAIGWIWTIQDLSGGAVTSGQSTFWLWCCWRSA